MTARITDGYGTIRPEDLPPSGLHQAREALAALEGVPVDHVALTCGGSAALTSVLTVLRIRANITGLEELTALSPRPHFPAYPSLAILCGFRPKYYNVPDVWTTEAVENLLQIIRIGRPHVILVNSPHNPTGVIFPGWLLNRISEEATTFPGSVLLDEAFSGIVLRGFRTECISIVDNVVRVGTFNKRSPAMADIRLGYILGDRELVADAALVHRTLSLGASVAAQQSLIAMINGDYLVNLERLCFELREHLKLARQLLSESPYLTCSDPVAGFFMLVSLKGEIDSAAFARELKEATGLWCAAAPSFGVTDLSWIRLRLGVPVGDLVNHCRSIVAFAARWYESSRSS
jgi:aspartate/methionine/tyrosine aminotransferase